MADTPIEVGLARYIDRKNVGLRLGTNLWVGVLPDSDRDEILMVGVPYVSFPGLEPNVDPHSSYDTYRLDVMSRGKTVVGDSNPVGVMSGRQPAENVYNILHMLDLGTIEKEQPDDTDPICYLINCEADGPPRLLEIEGERQRPIWGNTYTVQVRSAGGLRDQEG